MILFGEESLRTVVRHFVAHYHSERNHQGLANQLIVPEAGHLGNTGTITRRQRLGGMLNYFYEKVVKVKADVAAIIIFSPARFPQIDWTRPRWRPSGGCARGVSAERFETPLAGGAAALMCASAFCWRTACQRRGGNPPAPAFPRMGKRERGSSDFLAADSSRGRGADGRHAAGLLCARSPTTFSSRFR